MGAMDPTDLEQSARKLVGLLKDDKMMQPIGKILLIPMSQSDAW